MKDKNFIITENKACDICGNTNSELATFKKTINGSFLNKHIGIKPTSYVKKIVLRYIRLLLKKEEEIEINVCQSCTSKIFRSYNKAK